MNSLSHSHLNLPRALDDKFLDLFSYLKSKGVLKDTFVIFLSDHGMRFGKFTNTPIGWLEERLPFLFIWVPESFRQLYPQKYSNIKANSDKLVTPFDIYLTMREIIYESPQLGTPSCPQCVSLFGNISAERTCEDASIPQHWCACTPYQGISSDSRIVKDAIKFVLGELNSQLHQGKQYVRNRYKCAHLSFRRVDSAKQGISESGLQMLITFWASPGNALFQATVRRNEDGFQLLGAVSRLNAYGTKSGCIDEPNLQKYCYCKAGYTVHQSRRGVADRRLSKKRNRQKYRLVDSR